MKFAHWTFLLNAFLQREGGAQEEEKNDHLTCFTIEKDTENGFDDFKVKMDANMKQHKDWSVDECEVVGATKFCVPSTKVLPQGAWPDPTLGEIVKSYDPNRCIQNDLLCYKVRCDPDKKPDQVVIDQFNKMSPRVITFKKTKMFEICTPTWKVGTDNTLIINDACRSSCCAETDPCKKEEGECVKDCVKTNDVLCRSICKEDDCQCRISLQPCEQPKSCTEEGGTCIRNCRETNDVFCRRNLCPDKEDCSCEIPRCEQTDECKKTLGTCVPNIDCDQDENIKCNDALCPNKYCTCKSINPPCEQPESCTKEGGRCIKDCTETNDVFCRRELCPDDEYCSCEIPRCNQTDECYFKGGDCVPRQDCIPIDDQVECNKEYCKNDNCLCEIILPPCKQPESCAKEGGRCIKNCFDTDDVFCRRDLCLDDEYCSCEIPRCNQTDECSFKGGDCVPRQDCTPIDGQVECNKEYCKNDNCLCEIILPPCKQPESCTNRGGRCIKNCFDTDDVFCRDMLCPDDIDCSCEIPRCNQTDECYFKGGDCVPRQDCIPIDNEVECKPYCETDNCLCEIIILPPPCKLSPECEGAGGRCIKKCLDTDDVFCRRDLCPDDKDCSCEIPKCDQTKKCHYAGGDCVPRLDCTPIDDQVECKPYCKTEDCSCEIIISPSPCELTPECKRAGGRCIKKCLDTDDVFCRRDLCLDDEDCSCEIPKCDQTKKCDYKGGNCVARQDCTPIDNEVECKPYCKTEDCSCEIIILPPPCKLTPECEGAGGRCIKQCQNTDDVFCRRDLCLDDEDCSCEIPKCDQTKKCYHAGGDCVPRLDCTPIDDQVECKPYCETENCSCEIIISPSPCELTPECKRAGGRCIKQCQDTDDVFCKDDLCPDDRDCSCEIPKCDQTKRCYHAGGNCVRRLDCTSIDNEVECKPYCKTEDCSCEIILPLCKQPESCTDTGGRCIKQCKDTDDVFCRRDLCLDDEDCSCEIPKCDQSTQCTIAGGECTKDCQVSVHVKCIENKCKGEDCLCMIPDCQQSRQCASVGGQCIVDCEKTSGVDCVDTFCVGDHCSCAIRKCNNPQDRCKDVGGKCMYKEDCANNPMFYCRNYCTENDECDCAIRKDCKQTPECIKKSGTCTKNCVDNNFYACEKGCGEDCECMVRRRADQLD